MNRFRMIRGTTLIELMLVLAILVGLAALVVPQYAGLSDQAKLSMTRTTLTELQTLLINRYVQDMSREVTSTNAAVAAGLPGPHSANLQPTTRQQWPQLAFLFVNPLTNDVTRSTNPLSNRGWRGPYLLSGRHSRYPGDDPGTAVARGFTNLHGVTVAESQNGIADQTVLDAWGNPIVIRLDPDFTQTIAPPIAFYELVSAGPDGDLNTEGDNIRLPLR